jgi:hypothetical protein
MMVLFCKMALAACITLVATTTLQAQQTPLQAGSYRCYTSSNAPAGPAVNPRDADWRRSQGLPPLERGQRATPPMQAPLIMIMPAFFGTIVMDGKGNYKTTGTGKTGKYGFNAATATPTFTGDLSIMQVRGYNSATGRFFLVYDTLAFQCSLQGAAGQNKPVPAVPVKKSNLPVTAAALTGRFTGSYVCGAESEFLQLDTKAADTGVMVAVFQFGGSAGATSGTFTLQGKWTKDGFSLKPTEWIKQPSPVYEMAALDGVLTDRGLAGRVAHRVCSTFDVAREKVAGK